MAKCIWILAEIALDNLKNQTFLWLDILLCQNNEIKQEKIGTITNASDPNNQSYFLLKKQTSIKNQIVKVYFFLLLRPQVMLTKDRMIYGAGLQT